MSNENSDKSIVIYHKYFIFKFLIVALLLFLILIITTINKPLTNDEGTFASSWQDMHKKGIYALGTTDSKSNTYKNLENELGHPPLYRVAVYMYTLLFGLSTMSIRFFGIICYLISMTLIYKILKIYQPLHADKLSLLTISILITHPFLAINSMVANIDTTVLPIAFLLFTYYFLKKEPNTWKDYITLIICYAIAFWAKELLAVFISITLFLYYLSQKNYLSAIKKTFIISFFGSLLFVITWILFAWFYNIPVEVWFMGTIWNKVIMFGFQKEVISTLTYSFLVITRFLWKILFYLIPFVTLIVISIYYNFTNKKRNKRFDFLYIFIIIQFLIFTFYFYMNTYYLFTALLIGSITITQLIYERQIKIKKNMIYFILGLTGYYLLFGNPIFKAQRFWVLTQEMDKLLVFPEAYFVGLYYLLYFLPYIIATILTLVRTINIKKYIILCLCMILSSSIAFNLFQTGNFTTATIWNNYGEKGFPETIEYLNGKLIPNSILITRKDLRFYLNDEMIAKNVTYVYNKVLKMNDENEFNKRNKVINYAKVQMFTTDIYTKKKRIKSLVEIYNFTSVFESGDFSVYVRLK